MFPSSYAPNLGGVEQLTARLAAGLESAGHEVGVITNRWPSDLPQRDRLDGIVVERIAFVAPTRQPVSLLRFVVEGPLAAARTIRAVRRARAEIVHVQCVSVNALYALVAARVLRIPLVVTMQGELTMDTHQVYEHSFLLPRLLRYLLRRADRVTACSGQTLREAEERMAVVTGRRGSVVFNGVDLEEFERPVPDAENTPFVFAIGRHVPEKGFDVLIEAFARLGRDDLRLVIAGDGSEHRSLRSMADRLGVGDRVELPGRANRERTAELFRGCEYFVLPSRHEPFGIVNVEAMASEKAIIATAVGGVPEIVRDGDNGLLVEPGDAAALADRMRTLLDEPELRDRLAAAGRKAADDFAWPAITARYVSVYEAALADRS